ncbi:MAG: hypothetical protein HQ559_01905 [Lentisphaerae bacterium]|nr:hypothetical protein [Lentisphaerota bacterium]
MAIVKFPHASIFQFGLPNDEALNGHPLYKNGLTSYAVHRVENSSWIQELEERNSVHDQHDRERFLRDRVHYVFTFHDSTLECVVTMGERPATEIHVCPTEEEANEKWKESIGE